MTCKLPKPPKNFNKLIEEKIIRKDKLMNTCSRLMCSRPLPAQVFFQVFVS